MTRRGIIRLRNPNKRFDGQEYRYLKTIDRYEYAGHKKYYNNNSIPHRFVPIQTNNKIVGYEIYVR